MLQILHDDDLTEHQRQAKSGSRARTALALAALAIAVLVVWRLLSPTASQRLDVVQPRQGPAVLAIYGTGEVEPIHWAKLATASTARLKRFEVAEGDKVRTGQVLGTQDDSVEQATLAELEARQKFYETDYERKERLAQRDIVSQQTLSQTRAFAEEYAAKVRAQKERIALLAIRSPIDGTVLKRDGELGELMPAGTTVLWVGDLTDLHVVASIDEEDIALVREGQKVLVKSDAFPGRAIEGRVARVTPKGDPVAKTFRVRAALPKDSGLLVGMTAEINIVVREVSDALLVPATAVSEGHVLRVVDGKPVKTTVETGIRSGNDVEITRGLTAADQILRHADNVKAR